MVCMYGAVPGTFHVYMCAPPGGGLFATYGRRRNNPEGTRTCEQTPEDGY